MFARRPATRFEEQARKELWRSRRRKLFYVFLGILSLPFVLICIGVLYAYVSGAAHRIDSDAWATGNIEVIASSMRGQNLVGSASSAQPQFREDDPFRLSQDSAEITKVVLNAPPAALVEASKRWVALVNQANPGAIVKYEVDEYGNLILFPGVWYYHLSPEEQFASVDQFGGYWRSYLHEAFGTWLTGSEVPNQQHFAPGVVFMDSKGEVARNLNGYIRVLRKPEL